jgi:Family of unknown function (DUF5304)
MAEATSGNARTRGAAENPATAHTTDVCPVAWCPICLAVTTVQPLKPDVIEHLLKAGTELLLALRSVVDARSDEVTGADGTKGGPVRLEKIDIG